MKKLIVAILVLLVHGGVFGQDAGLIRPIPVYGNMPQMELSPDGQIAATYENGAFHNNEIREDMLPIRLYDVESGELLTEISGTTDYATDIAFSADGMLLASYHPTGYLNIWDAATGELVREIPTLMRAAYLQFMPDNHSVALSGVDSTFAALALLDSESGAITNVLMQRFPNMMAVADYMDTVRIPNNPISAFDILPSGTQAVMALATNDVVVWSLEDGQERVLVDSENDLPRFDIRKIQSLNSSAHAVYSVYREDVLSNIDLVTGTVDAIPAEGLVTFAVAPNDDTVAWLANGDDGAVMHVTRLSAPDTNVEIPLILPEALRVTPATLSMTFTPDGQQVVIGGLVNTDGTENQILVVDVG